MSLTPGTKLGPYEILSPLGAGGMGEVYRARDTKLGREVAIKVLPEAFAQNEERLARFEREARLLASLNHPNVATLHGLESSGDQSFLVMELVEGETLADAIARGPLPIEEALSLFRQIAAGLEAAHEKGVVHRDLKPANIKITPDGDVKILDFGLAKALAVEDDSADDISRSPTLTKGTALGVIMGTAPYMSPEQARGKAVDKRTDIWAFGCCLYETLTSRRPFDGDTVTDILAAVVKNEPDWNQLPADTPQSATRVLRRCLEKDRRRRLRDIGDVQLELEETSEQGEGASGLPEKPTPNRVRQALPWVLAAGLGLVSLGLLLRGPNPSAGGRTLRRFALDLPWQTVPNWTDFRVTISPQGRHLAYAGRDENRVDIYLRPLDSLEASPLSGPANPWNIAFSPDGERLAYFSGRELRTVSIQGGQPEPVCEISWFAEGLSWGSDGSILIGADDHGLSRVPANGGAPQPLTHAQDNDAVGHVDPTHLPSGRHALFTILGPEDERLAVADLVAGTWKELPLRGTVPLYSPSGHLLFRQQDELWAVPFDVDSLEIRGAAVSILDGIAYGPRLALDGTLVYVAERSDGNARRVGVDRIGLSAPLPVKGP